MGRCRRPYRGTAEAGPSQLEAAPGRYRRDTRISARAKREDCGFLDDASPVAETTPLESRPSVGVRSITEDGLRLEILFEAVYPILASVTRAFVATEGGRSVPRRIVDMNLA